jgi:hypothetical protein
MKQFLLKVSWSPVEGKDRLTNFDMTSCHINGIPPTHDEMQTITFAAKMAYVKNLKNKKALAFKH